MGVLVAVKPDKLETDELRIGHVVGLHRNGSQEIIPLILFAGNLEPTPYHYANLDLFTSY
jgi:hypothetical protein